MTFVEAARSLPGRVVTLVVGLGGVALIVRGMGADRVGAALADSAAYLPLVLALEAGFLACSMLALRSLYGDAARAIPMRELVRAGLVGYVVTGLLPAGRAVAEVARASLLAKYVGTGRAAAAATRMEGVTLVANGIVSLAAIVATLALVGATWLPLAIAINAAVTLVVGGAVLGLARRGRVGGWIGKLAPRAREFGDELDSALEADRGVPVVAIAWETAGRLVQVVQVAVLIACVGGTLGVGQALCAEGIHLVGAAAGGLIPAQLGSIEGNFALAAGALGLTRAAAVSIALLQHVAQLAWIAIGAVVPMLWRPAPTQGEGTQAPPHVSTT